MNSSLQSTLVALEEEMNLRNETDIENIDESGDSSKAYLGKIKIKTKQSIMGELIDRLQHDAINLFPDFQRKGDLWKAKRQSLLIESILLQMPIPSFYFDGSNDEKWQVVDGLQRLSTIRNFVIDKSKDSLKLKGLEFLTQFEGYTFEELPYSMKRRINTFPITLYIIEEGTSDEVKFILFKRINTGGLTLSPQEIRHALNQGIPSKFVAELADLDVFKEATQWKIRTQRMEDRDFTTRFIAFYLLDYEKEYKTDLDSFMNKGLRMLKSKTLAEREDIKKRFKMAMQAAIDIFEDDAFRKRVDKNHRKRPINKALFEVISVNFAKLSKSDIQDLVNKKEEFKDGFINLMNQESFYLAVSVATGQKSKVLARFEAFKLLITLTLHLNFNQK